MVIVESACIYMRHKWQRESFERSKQKTLHDSNTMTTWWKMPEWEREREKRDMWSKLIF